MLQTPHQSLARLTEFIETRFHIRHREQLPGIIELCRKVEKVHAGHPDMPVDLADVLQRMRGELEMHMKKEELMLFPMIRLGNGGDFGHPIAVMRSDHDDHSSDISIIESKTCGFQPPIDACRTWRTLYRELNTFVDDLKTHIWLENDVLFPAFQSA